MLSRKSVIACAAAAAVGLGQLVQGAALNGADDYGTDSHGYYFAISGGQFPTGSTPNGDNASGGTYRFLVDDAVGWGRDASESGVWQKDDWYSDNAGIGLTLRNGTSIVYDNNGLEADAVTPASAVYYDSVAGNYPTGGHGAVTAYSMSNNYDWIYAGYFKIVAETTVTSLTGYFAYNTSPSDGLTAGFDPSDPDVRFRMNIWSNVSGDLLPTDTDSFDGDVFTSDLSTGTFSWSDTGYNRVGSSSQQDIYRMTYTLNSPIVLQPGEYWFSHDAVLVPEPGALTFLGIGASALLMRRRRRA
ncbi:MAG: PEP-CTERM sorting domain-containing protein [Phycisphaerales bacterium]|nr:PEP-CTERM sorting domain-containing protein [Phycisphaerales bacterium]